MIIYICMYIYMYIYVYIYSVISVREKCGPEVSHHDERVLNTRELHVPGLNPAGFVCV